MTNKQIITNGIAQDNVEFVSMTEELTRFRRRLESEADKPIHEIQVNAAELLSDLVVYLKLGVKQHDRILGQSPTDYLSTMLETRISLSIRH